MHLSYFLLYQDSLILFLLSCLSVSLSLSLSSTFIYHSFAFNVLMFLMFLMFPLLHWNTCFSDSISLSLFLLRVFFSSIRLVSCTSPFHPFCLQTLPLSLSSYYSHTLPAVSLSLLKYFSCTFFTSSCSFHPQSSAPYINILSIML
jgi:hypothetical protein